MRLQKTALLVCRIIVVASLVAPVVTSYSAKTLPADTNCEPPGPPNYWCISPTQDQGMLSGIAVADNSHIWAVGGSLIEFWNGSTWSSETVPSPEHLLAVAASSTTNAWAVGDAYQYSQSCVECPLVKHFDGNSWTTLTRVPNGGDHGNGLAGITSLPSTNDALVVGAYNTTIDQSGDKTLIERCSSSGCSLEDSPNKQGAAFNSLKGVVAFSTVTNQPWADTAYAVGYYSNVQGYTECDDFTSDCRPLILKGTRSSSGAEFAWSVEPDTKLPDIGFHSFLRSIDVFAHDDIWAVGSYYDTQSQIHKYRPLIMHYDGNVWSLATNVYSPSPLFNELNSVFVTRERDGWVVGDYQVPCPGLRGNSQMDSPNCGEPTQTPNPSPSLDTDAPTTPVPFSTTLPLDGSAFALASQPSDPRPSTGLHTFIMHWHGSSLDDIGGAFWDFVDSPNPSSSDNRLLGVAAPPSSQPTTSVWAVGSYNDGSADSTLVENFVAPAAPSYSRNYFIESLDASLHRGAGYSAGLRGETGVVVLDYGSTRYLGNGIYGTSLPPTHITKVTTSQIETAVESFVEGYHAGYCTRYSLPCPHASTPIIVIAVGTDNYSKNGYRASLTANHAYNWTVMIRNIEDYAVARQYSELNIAAAFDAEPSWSDYSSAALWATNYLSYDVSTYYDFGSADAYPCDAQNIPRLPSSLGCADWYVNQSYSMAWQTGRAVPLPEMYGTNTDSLQAGYWYAIKWWSVGNPNGEMQFGGVTTHFHSSASRTYTPEQGWQVLWVSMNGDPATRQQDYMSTDFCDITVTCNVPLRR